MRARAAHSPRRGVILILVTVSLIGVLAMVALAIDLGLVTLARTQSQSIVDMASLAGARELNGDSSANNNFPAAEPTAKAVVAANKVLGKNADPNLVTVEIGYYAYDPVQKKFNPDFSGNKPPEENWSAVRATMSNNHPTFFAKVFNVDSFNVNATATAVHRPRDVAIVLDFSGSMHFSSQIAWPTSGTIQGALNPDPRYPKFGHWQPSSMQSIMYRDTIYVDGGGEAHAPANMTIETENGPAIVNDFLYRDSSGNLVPAFNRATFPYDAMVAATPAPADFDVQSDATTTYVGDKWPRKEDKPWKGYAKTVKEFIDGDNNSIPTDHPRDTSFEPEDPNNPQTTDGYGPNFKGYSMGPGYYGKTFYIWPPDPRYHPTNPALQFDWRKKFFRYYSVNIPMDDNAKLFYTSSGRWRPANSSSSYRIKYDEVIQWIKSGPQVFPPNLRAGRLVYYTSIPDTIPSSGGTLDQRFWREYIDHVIGAGSSTEQYRTLYGRADYTWGTWRVTPNSDLATDPTERPYMYYRDNPRRPKLHFWFGPLTMLAFIMEHNYNYRNWIPGTAHEAQTWQLKAGIQSALGDIKKNHPNDWAGLVFFSALNEFSTERVQMGREYERMKNALFYPYSQLDLLSDPNAEIRPYDSGMDNDVSDGEIPNGHGGTSPEMGFKLAYNIFSSHVSQKGRTGASKVVIFETDGVPNTLGNGSFVNNGPNESRYTSISRGSGLGNNHPDVISAALNVVERICALDTDNPPGYSTVKNPARVHAIAFGDLFQSTSYKKAQALDFLLQVQQKGNTSSSSASSIEPYKIITGDFNTRIANLRLALERIMQSGVQVALLR